MSGVGRTFGLILKQIWRRLRQIVSYIVRNPLSTSNQNPTRLVLAPVDLRQADIFVASEIIAGRFPLAGTVLETEGRNPFLEGSVSPPFDQKLHAFRWLRHLRASSDQRAGDRAKQLTDEWMASYLKRMSGSEWEFETVTQRLIAFLSHSPIILEKADQDFYQRFLFCIAQHVRYLRRVIPAAERNSARLKARIALAMASICLPSSKTYIRSISAELESELGKQILPDGGHISRNPLVLLDLLADLLPLRQTYLNLDHALPKNLLPVMDQMFAALRFFRHSSGDIALFNGSNYVSANYLMSILQNDEKTKENSPNLDDSGYARLDAARSVVLSDVGSAPKGELSKYAHAGCLSFEFSSGANRLIVNSGFPTFKQKEFGKFSRLTAAHSTLIVDDTSSARISSSSLAGPIFIHEPNVITFEKEVDNGQTGFTASHDGYAKDFNIIHQRQLRLKDDGSLFSGLDTIEPAKAGDIPNTPITIRFHIHPSVDVGQSENGMIFLTTKDGERWAFTSTVKAVVEKDIFFSGLLGSVNSQQITLSFETGRDRKAAWIFKALHTSYI